MTIGWGHRCNTDRLYSSIGDIPPGERYTNHFQHAAFKAA